MKKVLLAVLLIALSSNYAKAQCPSIRYIEVIGKAEKEIPVNEIHVQITLREYFKDPKSQKSKVLINQLEAELQKALASANVPSKNLTISNISAYNSYYNPKSKKPSEYMASKQYLLKLSDISTTKQIISALDTKGLANTYVSKYSNTEMKNHETGLQKQAFINAKEKATHILSVAGAKLGKVLEIHNSGYMDDPGYRPLMMMRATTQNVGDEAMPNINFKNLKLRNEQRVLFEIL
ncbi:MAG: SIMPL domain-containing protein [Solitalea-like symbiont of Tyrophagus putrescentiae]